MVEKKSVHHQLLSGARKGAKKTWHHVSEWKTTLLHGFQSTQTSYLVTMALVVGVVSGCTAYLFHTFIHFLSHVSWGKSESIVSSQFGGLKTLYFLLPAAGGLVAGLLMTTLNPPDRQQGVPDVIHALLKRAGIMKVWPTFIKSISAVFTIGSGGSAGPEGPIAEIGGASGSFLGRLLKVPPQILRMLIAGGAAGGIAASFNAPIGGVFFALEVLIAEFTPQAFSIVVLSTVTATWVARALLGGQVYLNVPLYSLGPSWELLFYGLLGVLAGLFSKVYVRFLNGVEQLFESLTHLPRWIRPMFGGLIVGGMALMTPQILGSGHDIIEEALWGRLPFNILLALMLAKTLATSITLGSGGVGGVFLPGFYVGAMLGGAYGFIVQFILSKFAIGGLSSPGAFALVGMAALLAASTRAPITSIIIISEITNNHDIILPVMIATVLSTLISRAIESQTIYTRHLAEKGIKDLEQHSVRALESTTVEEIMTKKVVTISPALSLERLAKLVETRGHSGFPVIDDKKRLVGLVTFEELRDALGEEDLLRAAVIAGDLMRTPAPSVFLDQPVGEAVALFESLKIDRLAVVKRGKPDVMLGIVTQADVLRLYRRLHTGSL